MRSSVPARCAPRSGATSCRRIGPWLLAPALELPRAAERLGSGRGSAWRLELPGGLRVVVRLYRRGGLVARVVRETYLGPRPRPLHELAVTVEARRRGVPAPEVLGARVEGGLVYRGALVTAEVPNARTLIEALRARGRRRRAAARSRRAPARAVARLHDAGVYHADLNLTNLLVGAAGDGRRGRGRLRPRARCATGRSARARAGGTSPGSARSLAKLDPGGALGGPRAAARVRGGVRAGRGGVVRVLIVLPGAIGDVVRALPLLGRLRRARPEAYVGWAVEPPSAPLLAGHPWLNEVTVFERAGGARAFLAVPPPRAGGRLDDGARPRTEPQERHRRARERRAAARSASRAPTGARATGSSRTCHVPAQGVERPKLEQFLAFGDALGLPPAPVEFGLAPTRRGGARGRRAACTGSPRPIVAACLGSSCSEPALVPGPDRRGAARAPRSATAPAPCCSGRRPTRRSRPRWRGGATAASATSSAARRCGSCSRSSAAPTSPSAPTRARCTSPRPSACRRVSLWGATSAARSAPWGSEHLAVTGAAPCAPCFLKTCPIGRVCMRAITPDDVTGVGGAAA